ncbi:MAG: choice-of-anchor J domain-containing protein, partial [candidate division WOR-3 bacterium]|nr:choice-of-anchor J domain-containing protein [candidate division WOR-3 bacterium]
IRLTVTPQAPPANDVGVMRIIAPAGNYQVNTQITPRAVVKNYGTNNQTNFPVVCSIIGPAKAVRYVNTQTISLAAGDTIVVNFANYTPTITEYESVFVRTVLAGDERPTNDRKSQGFLIHSYMLLEGFNDVTFPPPGWQANILNGTYNWERFTTGTNPTCSPFEGAAMAGYRSYSASSGSMARLVSPPVNCGTTPQPINVIFAMYHDPGYPPGGTLGPDSIKVEYSTDGTNFTQVASFRRYEPTAGWTEHTVNLGTFSGTLYVGFLAFSQYGNNMFIDFVRMMSAGIEEQKPQQMPLVTTLNATRPNPVVNGLAHISFTIAEPSRVSLKIYDASGRIIKTLVNSELSSGVYNFTWNGTDENNKKVAEGIYFYTLEAGAKRFTKKLVYTQ